MKLLLFILAPALASMTASGQTEWVEREGYSVRSKDLTAPDIVTIQIVIPPVANSGGYYIQPGKFDFQTSLKAYTAIDEAGDEWEQENVVVPRSVIRSTLANDSKVLTSLTCFEEIPNPEVAPIRLYADMAFAIRGVDTNSKIQVDRSHKILGFNLQNCTLRLLNNKLAITFTSTSPDKTISQCAGILDISTGEITHVVNVEQSGQVTWINSSLVAIISPVRRGTAWSIVDFEKKKVVSNGSFNRSVGWIIFKNQIHIWIPEPMTIPIYKPQY